jgi:tetratricopeptide (TPR) repeat protein
MVFNRRSFCLAVLVVAVASRPTTAQHDTHSAGHGKTAVVGTIVFPNAGKPAAQQSFLLGIALLHNFDYADAAKAFRDAQSADPGFALAYWGEALTYSHVVWREEDLAASRAALKRLASTADQRLAKAKTARERGFGGAVEAFYKEGTLAQRVAAYANAMRRHAQGDPADQEAAAFASHAIMAAGRVSRSSAVRDALFREAAALSQRVLAANPNHPGATHYLIHLYDNPGLAQQGLEFARTYDKIAPDAEHALHMPSHIYLQLGMWADVVSSNERAWPASRAAFAPSWHTLSWLQYGYLEQGRWAAARALIDSARAIVPTLSGHQAYATDALFALTRLEFQYAAATGRWTQPLSRPAASRGAMSDREIGFRSQANYWLAVDAAQRNDPALDAIAARYVSRANSAGTGTLPPLEAADALVVRALVAKARNERSTYLQLLREAAVQEKQLTGFVGPPERLFASELLGAELIAGGRAADAIPHFETVLRLCPERSESLLGLARARTAAGDAAGAEAALAKLRVNWKGADPDVLALFKG